MMKASVVDANNFYACDRAGETFLHPNATSIELQEIGIYGP